jgi:hypothetical protein
VVYLPVLAHGKTETVINQKYFGKFFEKLYANPYQSGNTLSLPG